MRNSFLRRLSAITGTESPDTREYAVSSHIIAYTANKRRFQVSLNKIEIEPVKSEHITKKWTLKDANISDVLRKKLKL